MRLSVIDCNPGQTSRIRAWLRDHPGYKLFRDSRHHCWRISTGEREITASSWRELLGALDAAAAGNPRLRPSRLSGPPPQPSRRYRQPGAPDILA